MAKLLRKGTKVGRQVNYGKVKCESCGEKILSTVQNCPFCGATRKVEYRVDEIEIGQKMSDPNDLAKVEGGGHPCAFCGTLTWNYDAQERKYKCANGCGANTGEGPTDYELVSGQSEKSLSAPLAPTTFSTNTPPSPRSINWKPILGGMAALGITIFLIWLFFFNTDEVNGRVVSVYWERSAHQEENQLLDGEGFGLPAGATAIGTPESRWVRDQENIIAYTHGVEDALSTPEIIGDTQEEIRVETPGAIYTTEPYICSDPTPEDGGSVSYDMCVDEYQEDSTYGYILSDETPVYAPQVWVEVTTVPSPVYGTPTPIFEDWYRYTYWQWVSVGDLITSGEDNYPFWPESRVDDNHRIVYDTEYYSVVIIFDNGVEKTYEGTDPELLEKYYLGDSIIGTFNILKVLLHDNK